MKLKKKIAYPIWVQLFTNTACAIRRRSAQSSRPPRARPAQARTQTHAAARESTHADAAEGPHDAREGSPALGPWLAATSEGLRGTGARPSGEPTRPPGLGAWLTPPPGHNQRGKLRAGICVETSRRRGRKSGRLEED